MDMRQVLVTAGVMVEADRVLMAQRRVGDHEGGKWEFPGGKVELGEDPRQAIQRELEEELAIKVAVGRVNDIISQIDGDLQLILIYFECAIIEGDPQPFQCQQVFWGTVEQIDPLDKPAADARFWKNFRSGLATRTHER
jgi:8-oxo-dGTP diphosphatase